MTSRKPLRHDHKFPAPVEVDEQEVKRLIAKIKRGNQDGYAELVRRYRNQVAALAYKMIGDYDEAADVTQTVLVKLASNIWRFDEKKKFYTWLYRVTVNTTIDHIRKYRRYRHEPIEHYQEVIEMVNGSPEDRLRRNQLAEQIRQATRVLNEKQRSAFLLRDVEGCGVNDVAQMMEIPEATVRWYLHRARARMRKELTRRSPQLLLLFGIR
jgi:RNA polymerase sigma-70 factor (ECF subfamily)